MPREPRPDLTNTIVHVVNRSVNGARLFDDREDHAAFERLLLEAVARTPLRVLAFCVMPNHWHFVVWARSSAELSAFFRWLTQTHAARRRARLGSVGDGPVYQGRFKVFPVQSDEHLLVVMRYVERNALRAGLVRRAEDWPWGSLRHRLRGDPFGLLHPCPVPLGARWVERVNAGENQAELERLRRCAARGTPFGEAKWRARVRRRSEASRGADRGDTGA